MLLRLRHSRIVTPAGITVPDATVQYSAMRGPTAACRDVAQGGPISKRWRRSASNNTATMSKT
jgi:hypothetical protein